MKLYIYILTRDKPGRDIYQKILLYSEHSYYSLKTPIYTNFDFKDIVVGTISMTTLREPLFYICRVGGTDSALFGRTYKTDDLHIISSYLANLHAKLISTNYEISLY